MKTIDARTPDALDTLVNTLETRWPRLRYAKGGSRAASAAGMVRGGKVRRVGAGQYIAGTYLVDIPAQTCECEDQRAPIDATRGRLCKHMIAARFVESPAWREMTENPALLDVISQYINEPWIEIVFEYEEGESHKEFMGIRTRSMLSFQRIPAAGRFNVTLPQLRWALEQLGWSVERLPEKGRWLEHHWRIAPVQGIELTVDTWMRRGHTDRMRERNFQTESWRDNVAVYGNATRQHIPEAEGPKIYERRVELTGQALPAAA